MQTLLGELPGGHEASHAPANDDGVDVLRIRNVHYRYSVHRECTSSTSRVKTLGSVLEGTP